MRPSDKIKELIKGFEGCKLAAYLCPAGVLTIGYGHTGPDVRSGMVISHAKAVELFERDIETFARSLDPVLPQGLKQHQYDALLSFAYNVGVGALKKSALLRKVKADASDPSIPYEFSRWTRAKGSVVPGLVTRRKAEADIYLNGYDKH